MGRLSLLIFCLLCLPNCKAEAVAQDTGKVEASSADEETERNIILNKVQTAIAANDFAGLSAMEDDYRSSRARTPSGTWKLAVFHVGLQTDLADGLQSGEACQYRKAQFVQRWAAATPHNPAPAITNAALLLSQAWCIRGGGYANSVTPQAWPAFREKVAAASQALDDHETMASIDPEFYAIKLKAMRSQGDSKAAFRNVIDEAASREPYYDRIYSAAAWYYLPQWGGSFAEVEQLARYAADRTRVSEKNGFYARVFWSLDECGCDILAHADWSTFKQGMRDVYDRYPVRWHSEYFAKLSCRMGDAEEGRHYIRAIHPEATGDADFAALFATCDSQAKATN